MPDTSFSTRRSGIRRMVLAAILGLLVTVAPSAGAQTFTVIYAFLGPDGQFPLGALERDADGTLYGTTYGGGDNFAGTVFKITPDGTETVLHSFGLGDGFYPDAGLVRDAEGNLYGTTGDGGAGGFGFGTVFEVTPDGTETVLYTFTGGMDGARPINGLTRDADGTLYSTTKRGGANGNGTVFKLTATGTKTILHTFTGKDGGLPLGNLVRDKKGNLYGTTSSGGANGNGTVFKLAPTGEGRTLHSFAGGTDGAIPYAGLVRDAQGNLYGTTSKGGTDDKGTVFMVTPTGKETVLHSFAGGEDEGALPWAGLILDADGNLYGTTLAGGTFDNGTVFQLTPTGTVTVLYSFTGGEDGANPVTSLRRDADGNLYGTTMLGGMYGAGVVFKLAP